MERIVELPPLPARAPEAHKGSFGHVLAVGGALGMSGALALAGRAAGRAGAGLVSLACPAPSQPIVAALVPDALTIPLPGRADGRIDPGAAAKAMAGRTGHWTVLAAGCGWGTDAEDELFADESVALMEQLARQVGGPTVIDADGLNLLAATGRLWADPWPNLVLTPHPGEMGRLLDCSAQQVQADREAAITDAVERLAGANPGEGPVVVLKGHGTLVCDGHRLYANTTRGSALATGGTGDVLTGLLAGLLAQGMERFAAAVLAVHLHGLAGDLAAADLGEHSVIASDVVDYLPRAMAALAGARHQGR